MSEQRPTLDAYMMQLARVASARATCLRRSVGCVLADGRGRVMAVAYNGVPAGQPHCNAGEHRAIASVPFRPRLIRDADYLDRVWAKYPELRGSMGGYFDRITTGLAESLVPGEVAVFVTHYKHACKGSDLQTGADGCEGIHAEQNAILQCGRADDVATAYVTLSPCRACAKLLMNTGCRRIVFDREHDLEVGEMWTKSGPGRTWELLGDR